MPVDAPAAAGAPVGVLGADGVGVAARDHRELGEAQATPGKCVRACVRIGWVQQGVERGEERRERLKSDWGLGCVRKKKGCVCVCVYPTNAGWKEVAPILVGYRAQRMRQRTCILCKIGWGV